MKRMLWIFVIGWAAFVFATSPVVKRWFGTEVTPLSTFSAPGKTAAPFHVEETAAITFSCDGRTYCSQMKSCEEAKYFVRHCPGTKMDGDGDGIPCESQWCFNEALR